MKNYADLLDDLNDEPEAPRRRPPRPKRSRAEILAELVESGDNTEGAFNPSFHSSRHERAWILTYLGPFYEDHLITDVLRQVKGGKEATVYCCQAHPVTGATVIAAKVYRPRMFRNLRNDALYRQGQSVRDPEGHTVHSRREQLAMAKKTVFGQELRHQNWLANEFETLQRLLAAGADVPRPFSHSENAILMEYLGTPEQAAPPLSQVRLAPEEARLLFERLLWNVELMLAHDRVHGDLSAYNVLYDAGAVKIIDFPQAVDPVGNPAGQELLRRDITRLCGYFARYGIAADGVRLADDLWRQYVLAGNDAEPDA